MGGHSSGPVRVRARGARASGSARRALRPDGTEGCARASASEAWRGELRADWREQRSTQLLAGRRGLGCTRGPARAEAANARRRR